MKIISHRGASGYAPENTLAAIKKAIDLGTDGIEIDIQLTKDEKIVVFHDWKLDRTTTGKGYVFESDFNYIRSLDAGSWYSEEFKNEKVPTLEEVLELIPKGIFLNIEIKNISRDKRGMEEKLLEILNKYPEKMEEIVISTFHHKVLKKLEKLAPNLKLAFLTSSDLIDTSKYIKTYIKKCYSYHPEVNLITEEAVKNLKENSILTFVWTVNTEEDLKYLQSINVDGVITNYPDLMRKLI